MSSPDHLRIQMNHRDEKGLILLRRKIGPVISEAFVTAPATQEAKARIDKAFMQKITVDQLIDMIYDDAVATEVDHLYATIHRLQSRRWYHLLWQSIVQYLWRL